MAASAVTIGNEHELLSVLSRLVPLSTRAAKYLSPFSLRTLTLTHPHHQLHHHSFQHSLPQSLPPSIITTAIGVLSLVNCVRASWSSQYSHLHTLTSHIRRPSLHASPKWPTSPTRKRTRSRRRSKSKARRPATTPTARRRLPVTRTLACKLT